MSPDEPTLQKASDNREMRRSVALVPRAVLDQLYLLYFQSKRLEYFIYGSTFLVTFSFVVLATMVFGLSDEVAVVGVVLISLLALIATPVTYAISIVNRELRFPDHDSQSDPSPHEPRRTDVEKGAPRLLLNQTLARIIPFGLRAIVLVLTLLLWYRFISSPALFQSLKPHLPLLYAILAFEAVALIVLLGQARYFYYSRRRQRQETSRSTGGTKRERVLLIGAGRAGALVASEIQSHLGSELEIKGFIDDDPLKHGTVIHGVNVLGSSERLPRLVRELRIDRVIVSIGHASRSDFRRLLDICEQIPVKIRVMPSLHEILRGGVQVSRIRDFPMDDLLGRQPVTLDEGEMQRFLSGKTVMVTGAGGSIGAELARQVARFQPARLLLLDRAEFALFKMSRKLFECAPDLVQVPLVADLNDESRMRHIFSAYPPQVVLHAAAHKQVPMMENNPTEALQNNILATYLLGQLSGECGAEVFVLISTDKAVRPTSVMGASKRIAELVVSNLDRAYQTRFVAVRFGNVLDSRSAIIRVHREQIRLGGPVTVTHPEMTRYFITAPEASQLILAAASMATGGEIFVLDMGEPVRIFDLAKASIRLSGLKPFEDIDIVVIGTRPGEKLFEELGVTKEGMSKTKQPRILIAKVPANPEGFVEAALNRIKELVTVGSESEIRGYLNELLPDAQLKAVDFWQESQESWNIRLRGTG